MGTLVVMNREAAAERTRELEEIASLRMQVRDLHSTLQIWMNLFKDAQDEIARLEARNG